MRMLTNSESSNMKYPIFLDYQSTTPCDPEVLRAMDPYWSLFCGNPSGRQNKESSYASAAVSIARESLALTLEVSPERIIFTSGATEANNLALLGHARAHALDNGFRGHIITASTEHNAVLDPIKQLQKEGFRVTLIRPYENGILTSKSLISAIEKDTFLVSIMMANNEIGVIQPVSELAKICKERGIIFHSDAAQSFGNIPIAVDSFGIDLLTISGHKIYGPKGIGALIIRNDVPIIPLFWGGGQENGFRAGTLPVPLVVGLAKAAEIAFKDIHNRTSRFLELRNKIWYELKSKIPDLIINGSLDNRLANNLNFSVPGVIGSRLHRSLRPLISCSSGSACSNGEPSHVLQSIGRSRKESESSLRLSIGRNTTDIEVEKAIEIIASSIISLKQ